MKKFFLILVIAAFAIVVVFIFADVFEKSTRQSIDNKSKIGLLERPFNGSADFTSAVYDGIIVGCRTANSTELASWVKGKNNLPERTYALSTSDSRKMIFADKNGAIRFELKEESSRWLVNAGKISFLVVKDSTVIEQFNAGIDPAPNFPGR